MRKKHHRIIDKAVNILLKEFPYLEENAYLIAISFQVAIEYVYWFNKCLDCKYYWSDAEGEKG